MTTPTTPSGFGEILVPIAKILGHFTKPLNRLMDAWVTARIKGATAQGEDRLILHKDLRARIGRGDLTGANVLSKRLFGEGIPGQVLAVFVVTGKDLEELAKRWLRSGRESHLRVTEQGKLVAISDLRKARSYVGGWGALTLILSGILMGYILVAWVGGVFSRAIPLVKLGSVTLTIGILALYLDLRYLNSVKLLELLAPQATDEPA